MTSGFLRVLGLAGALALGTASAQAATVLSYSDFAKGEKFNQLGVGGQAWGPVIANGVDNGSHWYADQFTASAGGPLDHLDLAIANVGPYAQACCGFNNGFVGAIVSLVSDNGGIPNMDGSELETWVLTKLPVFSGTSTPVVKATKLASTTHPTLVSGTKYWIVVQTLGLDGYDVGCLNSTGATGTQANSYDGGTTWTPVGSAILDAFDAYVQ